MSRFRVDEDILEPSSSVLQSSPLTPVSRVLIAISGLKVQVVQPGTTTAVTVYQAETGGATYSWFGTDARGVVVPFTADPATTGVAIVGAEMWIATGQTVELRVLQAGVEVARKRVAAISPLVERGSGLGTQAQLTAFIATLPAGVEYSWHLTDGAGTLLDIVTGVV